MINVSQVNYDIVVTLLVPLD